MTRAGEPDMRYFDYPRYRKKAPRKAKGGIQAKSRRGQIGETWWSRRFIALLESFRMGARLTRGRSYARRGQVMDLEVQPGLVTSKVQGTRRTPYAVRIAVEMLPDRDWQRVVDALASQAIFMAQLLSGEMPRDIEEVFVSCRLSLFPSSTRDLDTSCSCPDWANPCKHIAATYYLLAEAFDVDPFLIFEWRGRNKERLTAALRSMRSEGAARDDGVDVGPCAWEAAPIASSLATFWQAAPELSELRARPHVALIADGLLRQLGPAPVELHGRNIADLLAPAYEAMTAEAVRRAEE